jgi:rubrerythrin
VDVEEAIKLAIEYETKVRDVYAEARKAATNEVGKRVFKFLAREEQGHLDYLHSKLEEWQNTGQVSAEGLETAVPSPEDIRSGVARLENRMAVADRGDEAKMLEKAYKVEVETGDFYKRMVEELGPEGQALFRRFVEIEEGHEALVQAELDSVKGTGYWFDMLEFDLEA